MQILFLLAIIIVLNWLVGLLAAIVLQTALPISLYRVRAARLTLPVIGYAVSNLLWWIGTFLFRWNSDTVILIGVGCAVLSFCLLFKRRLSRRVLASLLPAKCDWPVLIIIVVVVALSAWPYLAVGMGNYFLVNETDYFSRVIPAVALNKNVGNEITTAPARGDVPVLHDLFPIQLSSLTLLQQLLRCTATDAASLQAIFDLVLTAIGAYWLSRYVVRFRVVQAVVAAVFSVAGQFYFHTYRDGHLGSMIYVSAAPVFFGLCVWALSRNRYRTTLLVISVLWLFMGKAYPFVSYLLVPPLFIATLWLFYIDRQKFFAERIASLRVRMRISGLAFGAVSAALVVCIAIVSYHVLRRLFYPNLLSVIFNGYQPMYLVFDPHAAEWFYGLRLTAGFGYGFLDPSTAPIMKFYEGFAFFLAFALTLSWALAAAAFRKSRHGFFFSIFLISFPMMAIAFATMWPFSYLVYKVLYVHYFLIVMGIVGGFSVVLRATGPLRNPIVRGALYAIIGVTAALNIFGDYKSSVRSLEQIQRFDLADCYTLVNQLRSLGIRSVTVLRTEDLRQELMYYVLREAGISADTNVTLRRPLMTAQYATFSPIAQRDIVLRSKRGKYVISNTPDTVIQTTGAGSTSTEVRNGFTFRWLSSAYDYNVFQFEKYFQGLAGFLTTVSGGPIIYNDLRDSGYYILVNKLMDRFGIKHSYDPRECTYFVRLNRRIDAVTAGMKEQQSSAVIASVGSEAGTQRVGRQTYLDNGREKLAWNNELFEAVYIPFESRVAAAPPGIDVEGLIEAIQEHRLVVADGIRSVEHERVYIEDRIQSAGIQLVPFPSQATAVLVCMAEVLVKRVRSVYPEFDRSVFWRTTDEFFREHGYEIVLLRRRGAYQVIEEQMRELAWPSDQPLRAIIRPFKSSQPELMVRVYRFDRNLRLLFETGPSLRESHTLMRAMRGDGRGAPMFFTITAPSTIVNVPVDHFAVPGEGSVDIAFETDIHFPRRVLPYDDRLLLYRISDCELVAKDERLYTELLKRVLGANWRMNYKANDRDIVDNSSTLALGTGWYPREAEKGSPFRWMSDTADLVLENNGTRQGQIVIAGQVGPSAPSGEITIAATVNGARTATMEARNPPTGPVRLVLDCSRPEFQQALRKGQNVITLSVKGGGKEIAGDPRLLNFRVFHINMVDNASAGAPVPAK